MNKKVMALAVAGALAAPAALAQTTIYGKFEVEYGFYSPGDVNAAAGTGGQLSADAFNSGASRVGIRGEEKLGGGLAAWYQCESDVRFLDETTANGSLCDRNSAIGLKGGFGNLFFGTWDSPLKTASGVSRITNESGWLGTQGLLLTEFSNRNKQTINYQTPAMGGFTVNAQVSNTRAAMDQADTAANDRFKKRLMAIGGQFSTGPLNVVAGYEKREGVQATVSGGVLNAEDSAWLIGGTYRFGPFNVGLTYTQISFDDATPSGKAERNAWALAGQYRTGPHLFTAGYTAALDFDVGGTKQSNTGGNQIVVGYNYLFSKRTMAGVGFSRVDNDSAIGDYMLDNRTGIVVASVGTGVKDGDSSQVISFNLTHTF